MAASSVDRVVALIDCDCFYANVESQRLGLSLSVPLAVQQWSNLIAVNYAARACGVARFDDVTAALQKCPHIVLVHVDTVDEQRRVRVDQGLLPPESSVTAEVARNRRQIAIAAASRRGMRGFVRARGYGRVLVHGVSWS